MSKFYERDMTIEINSSVAAVLGIQTAAILSKVALLNEIGEKATVVSINLRFPFLSSNQVKHSLRTLEKHGFIESDQPEAGRLQMAKEYRVVRNG